jgi:hypothetical protein
MVFMGFEQLSPSHIDHNVIQLILCIVQTDCLPIQLIIQSDMNRHTDCSICSEPYNIEKRIPRGCSKCGNNVCEECLVSIHTKTGSFSCPFCKNPSETMLEEAVSTGMVCTPHKKRIVTLCCSSECKLPAGICDRADCSRLHKEYGTNSLPISFINEQAND